MSLQYFQEKIKEKRKNTPFREFVMEIASWDSFNFYKNQGLISSYPPSDRVINLVAIGKGEKNSFSQEIQKDKPFLYQFSEFFKNIEQECFIHHTASENCEYTNKLSFAKNCYLSNTVIRDVSNIFYSFSVKENSHNVFNSVIVWNNCDNIYFGTGVIESTNIFYSKYIISSSNIWFSTNLIGCSECILCNKLENKKYCIENKEYSHEEYGKKKNEILKNKEKFFDLFKNLKTKGENQGINIVQSYFVRESENVENGFICYRVKNGRNIMFLGGENQNENMYDFCDGGTVGNSDIYGVNGAGGGSQNIYLSKGIIRSSNIYYCYNLDSCSFCLGCINLQNKSYCIFNKEYLKEEWEKKVEEIFSTMEKDGSLGKYFPASMNPYYFNDTLASLIIDFSKEEIIKAGFMWRDESIKADIPEGMEIIYTTLPTLLSPSFPPQLRGIKGEFLSDYQGFDSNGNWKINPEIMEKVIIDSNGNYYKIVKQEYEFLEKYGLPLPEIHWIERVKLNIKI
ncbi:hypothetical protein HGA92_03065 [Candidatus Gracilibacteria bacterium]|nr:hypothetical protein [Candidatus Gracilibacteria bacterium]NUJ99085.1 hypothetical protein [Candidatus Gracilibacteria bacterium]